ncbi:MAG: SnoaL-like domain-containing protein [Saprospiraceae bacterium]|nr:SnoaL-like domain-containing protein [Saprospiraceae bacterium]
MKITKAIEAEIMQVLEIYYSSYLNGDLEKFASVIDSDYKLIGTAEVEVFRSKKEMLSWLKEYINEVKGNLEFSDKHTELAAINDLVLATELANVYSLANNQRKFYSKIRISTLLRNSNTGWKVVQQHGSLPDIRTGSGEWMSFDTLNQENLQLKEVVQRRTAELEIKNNELKIEAALERVRTVAMAMKTVMELQQVSEIIFTELKALGFNQLRNTEVIINHEGRETITSYYYSDYGVTGIIDVDYNSSQTLQDWARSMQNADDAFSEVTISEKEMEDWELYRLSLGYLPDPKLAGARAVYYYSYSIGLGALSISLFEPISAGDKKILLQFRNVFNLAYKRYNDIAQAEQQAREARIEAALERVRARTMAMHRSEELLETGALLFRELSKLDVSIFNCGYVLMNEEEKMGWNYGVNPGDGTIRPLPTGVPQTGTKVLDAITESWKKQERSLIIELDPQETIAHQTYMAENMPNFSLSKERLLALTPERLAIHTLNFKHGYLLLVNATKLNTGQQEMVMRFAQVFEMTYRRFLDLQRAEVQTREAQIEVALERVRAKSLAMHKSEELSGLSSELVKQVEALGVETWFCAFNIYGDDATGSLEWGSNSEATFPEYKTPREGIFLKYYEAGQRGETLLIHEIGEEACPAHYEYLCSLPGVGEQLLKMREAGLSFPTSQIDHVAFHKYGYVIFITFEPVPQSHDIFRRFAKVFEQTYTRFLDLQRAEAQAWEAQIEAALEKVRSSSLAVNRTDEFIKVAAVVFERLSELHIPAYSVTIPTLRDDTKDWDVYGCGISENGLTTLNFKLPYFSNPIMDDILHAKNEAETGYFNKIYSEEEKDIYYEYAFKNTELKNLPGDIKDTVRQCKAYGVSVAYTSNSMIIANDFAGNVLDQGQADILKRFAHVFEQAYIRFLDLQKAEAQAREALIEAALEKVRSRTMGMQKSEDLEDVIQLLFKQFVQLKIFVQHTGFLIDYKNREDMLIWLADEHAVFPQISIPYFDSPHWNSFREAKKEGRDFFTNQLNFAEKNLFYQKLFPYIPNLTQEIRDYYFQCPGLAISTVLLDNIGLYIENFEGIPYSDEENRILLRFGKVFQQTYTRFLDLQRAEAQAREAQIEAALERVRSRTMAMQKADELHEVVTLVVEKLMDLGVILDANGVILCTYFKDSRDVLHWIASPDFSFTGSYLLPYFDHPIFKAAWESKLSGAEYFSQSFSVEEKNSFFEYAFEHSDYKKFPDEFKNWVFQNDKHSLSFAWSEHSAILIPSHTGVLPSEEDIEILKRFAKVFEQAYVRFMDLQVKEEQSVKLSEEKQRLEKTLEDLQATQNQLIQAEKMASLGELTAGIAHEIKNPLNFVNNFSELSSELLDEMVEEIQRGDQEEAFALVEDLKQNLKKILEHGRRADGIVKGMLMHSRGSSGQKEMTNLNALCDEYLRLAYHGLRAKDNTFTVKMDTDFDHNIPEIELVSQDIGRVILNLITNAFYAVGEKNQLGNAGYQPKVSISTRQLNGKIEVVVSDNGPGIPQAVKDKIFQPFFTTKPAGQGTGLGLSLSYDIVKAHGGEFSFASKPDTGSSFTISIPFQST